MEVDIDMSPLPSPSPSPSSQVTASPTSSPSDTSSIAYPITPQSQSPLMRSPLEIIHKVLASSGGDEVGSISNAAKTCRELRSFIYENPDQALWRDIHLSRYDDPRSAGAFVEPRERFDWKKRIQDREFVLRIFREWGEDRYAELGPHLDLICQTLLDMYLDLPSLSSSPSDPTPREAINSTLLSQILQSQTFQHLYTHLSHKSTAPHLRPLSSTSPLRRQHREVLNPIMSRLHVLVAPELGGDEIDQRRQRGWLREVVYTSRNFRFGNDWGPFDDEGKVDWNLVDAIGSVMMANAKDVLVVGEDGWKDAVLPLSYGVEAVRGWGFNDLKRPEGLAKGEVWDWAGVEGLWCGSYAFLDYADWIAMNEPRLIQLRRPMSQLDLSRYTEAIGDLMRLHLVVDTNPSTSDTEHLCKHHTKLLTSLPPIDTHLPTSSLLPPIRFHGSSRASSGSITYPSSSPSSFVRGVVQLTADNPPQVRWTLVIRYAGEDRWRLEAVQVGGRGSKRGFFGVWTDALKEEHSPNGPIWYWKP